MRLVRCSDQDERETDGAVRWNPVGPKLRKAFQKAGEQKFSDSDGLQYIYEGSEQPQGGSVTTIVDWGDWWVICAARTLAL